MEKINFCTQCGFSLKEVEVEDNQITCSSCTSVLNAFTGEVISRPVLIPDYEPGDYPEGFISELYGLEGEQ
jgi:nitrite reductase/ring-hydroxylating ferredoxin subunit